MQLDNQVHLARGRLKFYYRYFDVNVARNIGPEYSPNCLHTDKAR